MAGFATLVASIAWPLLYACAFLRRGLQVQGQGGIGQ
jgi:hypothetical protein